MVKIPRSRFLLRCFDFRPVSRGLLAELPLALESEIELSSDILYLLSIAFDQQYQFAQRNGNQIFTDNKISVLFTF